MGLQFLPTSFVLILVINFTLSQDAQSPETAMDVLNQAFTECLQDGSFHCLRPNFVSFFKKSLTQSKIRITRDLSIVSRDGEVSTISLKKDQDPENVRNVKALEAIENFIASHDLRMRLPREFFASEVTNYVPDFLLKSIPEEIRVPLAPTAPVTQGRGLLKKVLIPFLLGLKFKATALLPLALALIALKTWKALTLGLLSMVLSGAMIIFKFSKPKMANYEILHYAHHHPHPIVEHASYDHFHGHGRSLAYRAHEPRET